MRIYQTDQLSNMGAAESLYVYNGLDTMVTLEVLEALLPQLTPVTQPIYDFSRALQGPVLEMNMRGVLVDEERRKETLAECRQAISRLTGNLNRIIREGIGFDFTISPNRKYMWPSDDQLKSIFYDVMCLPEVKKRNGNGELVRTVDHDALEKLNEYFWAEPVVQHIVALRDLSKKVSFLQTAVDPDGYLRTSFNIAGTTTGRFASSFSDFGTGTNLQNVENKLRAILIAPKGKKFCNIDLEQSDARAVGAIHWQLFRDSRYLDACESSDLHTTVARDGFPALRWTGDLKNDRDIANSKFVREWSYRDAAKRLGHGTNYQGQVDKMSRATHIPAHDVRAFQQSYLKRYPAFPLWWEWVERQIRDVHYITTMLGRRRYFFGHWRDPDTIRQAIAYEPQSITADAINRGLLSVWRANIGELLLQVHDSILFQFDEAREEDVVPRAVELIQQMVTLKEGRRFTIPAAAKVGWNWSDYHPVNNPDPDALRGYHASSRSSSRTRTPA